MFKKLCICLFLVLFTVFCSGSLWAAETANKITNTKVVSVDTFFYSGSEKGFSTCLSSKGEGLRYRLSRILHPQDTPVGGRWIVILSLALAMLYGNICFVGDSTFGTEALFDGQPELYAEDILPAKTVYINAPSKDQAWRIKNTEVLKTYLCALELRPAYYVMEPIMSKELKLFYMEKEQQAKGFMHNASEYGRIISISDYYAVVHFWNGSSPTRVYRLKKSIQVEDLYCLLEPLEDDNQGILLPEGNFSG